MIGKRIPHHLITDQLGAGGRGAVDQAADLRLGRVVALKFLSSGSTGGMQALEHFRREASAISRSVIRTQGGNPQHDCRRKYGA